MPITINGTGSLTGLSAGGLPDATVTTADIVDANVTAAKLSGAQSGSAPVYGCRAWCVFNGTTTGTNAPTAGGNVSTVQRTGTGAYVITFATAMQDANYAVVALGDQAFGADNNPRTVQITSLAAGSLTITTNDNAGVKEDLVFVSVAIFR